jgi:hypothetical protein
VILTLTHLWISRIEVQGLKDHIIKLLFLLEILIIVCLMPGMTKRVQQATQFGNILAFSGFATSQVYLDYNKEVLYGSTKERVTAAQNAIPAGEPFVAWIYAPFYLDFKRNPIVNVDDGGLSNPWAYLSRESKYFMIEHSGLAVRDYNPLLKDPLRGQNAYASVVFLKQLEELAADNMEILYSDGKLMTYKIQTKIPPTLSGSNRN